MHQIVKFIVNESYQDLTLVKNTPHLSLIHIFYEIIVCEKTDDMIAYQEEDFYFGPCLRKNKNGLFYEKWHRQLEIQKGILNSLEEQHPRYHEIMHLITMIEGEISGS